MPQNQPATARITILLAALSLAIVPMTALASHNSVGVGVQVVQADEAVLGSDAPDDNLRPDVPDDSSLRPTYANQLGDDARPSPSDQSGERYTDCKTAGEAGVNYAPTKTNNHCYIGYFDTQLEYIIVTSGLFTRAGSDTLYPVNPEAGDPQCPGPASDPVGYAQNAADGLQGEGNCAGSDHTTYQQPFGTLALDTDLMDAPFMGTDDQGSDGLGGSDVAGQEEGSGTLTFPFTAMHYFYIFGQPHPDNPSPSSFEAGSGIFGPSPLAGGSPATDLTGACGDRTKACTMLTPTDIKLYDRYKPAGVEAGARVCTFMPAYFTLGPGTLTQTPCGPFGTTNNQFVPSMTNGGFQLGVTDTWAHTLPGWHGNAWIVNQQSSTEFFDINCDGGSLCHDYFEDDDEMQPGNNFFHAVNPKVPTPKGPLWCAKPNFIGTAADTSGGVTDNGFYDYNADAIDVDSYVWFAHNRVRDVRDATHGPVRTVAGPVQDASPIHRSEVSSAQAITQALGGTNDEAIEDQVRSVAPAAVVDALDSADYTESGNDETHTKLGPDNQFPFSRTFNEGVRCDGLGLVRVFESSQTVDGGLQFNVNLNHQTAATGTPALKDPTQFGEDGLPAGEEGTHSGAWNAKTYSFSGSAIGVLNTNGDNDLDQCAQALGQPQPTRDFCPWQPIWDAYNPNCNVPDGSSSPPECGTVLENRNYDTAAGVGLYAVVTVTGPVAITQEDVSDATQHTTHTTVIGENNPTAQNCFVATSIGFEGPLAASLGVQPADLADELCPSDVQATALVTDAFDDQGGSTGGFSADVEFTKLVPTTQAVQDAAGGLGEDDSLCVTGVWNVQDGKVASDTEQSLDLAGDGTTFDENVFSDCDSLDAS